MVRAFLKPQKFGALFLKRRSMDPRIRHTLTLIHNQPNLNVTDVANRVNLSMSRLQHLYKAEAGCTLSEAIRDERLQRAARLLQGRRKSIKEIASITGYAHTSSFSRAFCRRFGHYPKVHRDSND